MNTRIPREAIDRFEIEYLATHGGGIPDCLNGLTEDEMEEMLAACGYRHKDYLVVDATWYLTTCGLSVCLDGDSAGFVHRP